jgi:hypothetical protein
MDMSGSGGTAPFLTYLTEVSDELHGLPALPWGKSPHNPLDRRLGGPQSQSGCYGKNKNLAPAIHPIAHCYTD